MNEYLRVYDYGEYLNYFDYILMRNIFIKKDAYDLSEIDSILAKYQFKRTNEDNQNILSAIKQHSERCAIDTLWIIPTFSCNHLCTYCHIMHNSAINRDIHISEENLHNGIDSFIKKAGTRQKYVAFYGGEPLLCFNLIRRAIDYIKNLDNKTEINIFTNGSMINDEIAQYIFENSIFIVISIDGPSELHDKARKMRNGESSHAAAIKGIEILKRHGCSFGVNAVLSKAISADIVETIDFLIDLEPKEIGCNSLHFFFDGENPLEVTAKESAEAFIVLFSHAREKGIMLDHLLNRTRLNLFAHFIFRYVKLKDCPACGNRIVLTPDGKMGYCEGFSSSGYDYFRIADIETPPAISSYQKWKKLSPFLNPGCNDCECIGLCGGNCPYDAFVRKKVLTVMDDFRCEQCRIMVEWINRELYEALRMKIEGNSIYLVKDEDRLVLLGDSYESRKNQIWYCSGYDVLSIDSRNLEKCLNTVSTRNEV